MDKLTIDIISDAYTVSHEDVHDMAMSGDKSALDALVSGRRIIQSSGRGNMAKIVFEHVFKAGAHHAKEWNALYGPASAMPDRASFQTDREFIEATIATGQFTHERETVALSY
jgi:hypothetical protein